MKYETLLKIYFELAAKRSISVHALAEKYHLSPRTIHRYLEELEKAGLPLYSKRGKNGGFAVVDSYRVSATCFTAEEYSLIVNALEAFRREVESETLDSTLNKIRAAKRGGTELQLKSDRLIIDASPWGGFRRLPRNARCRTGGDCGKSRARDRIPRPQRQRDRARDRAARPRL